MHVPGLDLHDVPGDEALRNGGGSIEGKKDVLAEVHERDRTQWLYVKLWHL